MFSHELTGKAQKLLHLCRTAGQMIVTAESCTGGLIAGCLTEIPGSSDVVERGYVCYSNAAKTEQLGVEAELIDRHGAVSAEVADAMANGALQRSLATLAVSVTGIAGPEGGTPNKPVGLVYLGMALKSGKSSVVRHVFEGDRRTVREATIEKALDLMLQRLQSS